MKKRFGKFINKHLKMIVVLAVIVAIAMGLLLMLISGNVDDRAEVPVDPAAEQQEDEKDKDKKDRPLADIKEHPGVSEVALNMYNARVDDISDIAQVAQLLEASDMREELGDYLVTLKLKGDAKTLIIAFDKKLLAGEDAAFDEIATWYAEQFLALIDGAEVVKWTYTIDGEKKRQ